MFTNALFLDFCAILYLPVKCESKFGFGGFWAVFGFRFKARNPECGFLLEKGHRFGLDMDRIWPFFGFNLESVWSRFGELLDLFWTQIGSNLVLAPIWIGIGEGSPLLYLTTF